MKGISLKSLRRKLLLVLGIFAVGIALLLAVVRAVDRRDITIAREQALLCAEAHVQRITEELRNGRTIQEALPHLRTLVGFGYEYCLYRPDGTEVYGTATLSDPLSYCFTANGETWQLDLAPASGWSDHTHLTEVFLFGLMIVVLLSVLILTVLVMAENHAKLRHLSDTDPLTGLLNRNGFNTQLNTALARRPQGPCVCAALDIDDFKFINDLYGHSAGDEALRALADALRDAFPEAVLARCGGDEFSIFLAGRSCTQVEESFRQFAGTPKQFTFGEKSYSFAISLGYAEFPAHGHDRAALCAAADMALYEVKLRGKRNCLAYSPDLSPAKRTQLGFALTDVSANLPGAFLIYRAAPQDDTLLFANQEMLRLTGCSSLDEFMEYTHRHFSALIRPDEREAVEASIWRQVNADGNDTNDYTDFHLAVRDGSYRFVLDHGRIVESRTFGQVFYVLFIDKEILKKHGI